MHSWIQNQILDKLIRSKTVRYKDLRPLDVEGNLFMYHLKGLITEKLVEKSEDGYQLSARGLEYVRTVSLNTGKVRTQPQILNAIVAIDDQGRYLMYRWNRQPNLGKVSLPHGMMHVGEKLLNSAERELSEKTGLAGDCEYTGSIYVLSDVDHRLVNVFRVKNIQGEIGPDCFWAMLSEISPDDLVEGFHEIIRSIEKHGFDNIFIDEIIIGENENGIGKSATI